MVYSRSLLLSSCLLFTLWMGSLQIAFGLTPLWLRSSAISPDGRTICFSYKGNLYTVPTTGGQAQHLTYHRAYDTHPVWSPSGKRIAFMSDREGSLDIWLIDVTGENLTRLTTHSGSERVQAFLSDDELLFSASGIPTPEDMQFPSATFTHLYKVRTQATMRPQRVSDISVGDVCKGPNGSFIYDAIKGYEDPWRKHHTSSMARDIWMMTPTTKDAKVPSYQQITTASSEDRNPVFVASQRTLYYLSEADGTMNVYSRLLDAGSKARQLTHFKKAPVRYLTASENGTLCFSQNGELYTLTPGNSPKKLNISLTDDTDDRELIRSLVTSGATNISHSPKGKEIAFIMGGDVFVTSLDYKTTRQITDTPGRERDLSFAPDGRSIVYDSERDGRWGIYRTTIKNSDEKQFTYATELEERCLTDLAATCFQPAYSPDGKHIAFLRNRTELCVMDAKRLTVTTVMAAKYEYSYQDGDQSFCWSPNSKWLLSEYIGQGGWNNKDIALIPADGKGKIINLTNSGYTEANPRWALDGKAFIFQSDRAGYRSHGSWGAERDEYICFLTDDAYQRFCMNKEERELHDAHEKELKEANRKEREGKKAKADSVKQAKADSLRLANPAFNIEDLEQRTLRLTSTSGQIGDAVLNKEGTRLYYVAPYALGTALWEKNLEDGSTSIKVRHIGGWGFDVTTDGSTAYMLQNGYIKKLSLSNGKLTNIDFETFYTARPAKQRAELFAHIWHQTREKLYDPDMNGADWDGLREQYARFLPHIGHGLDFAEMASEMLGELNVSHTGCRYMGGGGALTTAELGLFLDDSYEGDGLRVVSTIPGTPLAREKDIRSGTIITHIDGQAIRAGRDYYPLLAGKAGRYTRLTLSNGKQTTDINVRLEADCSDALYRRWVDREEHLVDSLSKGNLAYVHIRAMNADSFHDLYRRLLSDKNRNRQAVIVDTRHNGGGWLHNDICELLTGIPTVTYTPRGQYIGTDPYNRWTKPSCMLICEDNYSNAHGTPWTYKERGIGKLIGAPVPGTMTAVWWDNIQGFVFGIPQVGALDRRGHYLENQQLEPDILVISQPSDLLHGRDLQLEKAVDYMSHTK